MVTLPVITSAAALLVNSTVWIFGGLSTQPTNGLYTLDVSTAWSTSSPAFSNFSSYGANSSFLFPRYASSMTLGADGSSLWIFGGNSSDTRVIYLDQFAVFDTQAKSWVDPQDTTSAINGATAPSICAQSAVSNSKGVNYFYGGFPDDPSVPQANPTLMTLDTRKNNFTLTMTNSGTPGNLAWHTATLVNDTLMYVIGGVKQNVSGIPQPNFYNAVYNTATNTWNNPPINSAKYPQARSGHSAVLSADNSQIVLFGGMNFAGGYLNDVWTLNLATNQWAQMDTSGTAPSGRAYHNSVMVKNLMVVFLGALGSNSSTPAPVYVLDTTTWTWVTSFTPAQAHTGTSSLTPDATSNSTSNTTTDPGLAPIPTNPIAISKAGVAGIIVIAIIIVTVAVTSVSKPHNRIKPHV